MGAEEIIQAAVAEAEGGGGGSDGGVDAPELGAETAATTEETPASTETGAAAVAGAPALDEIDSLIEKHGGVKLHRGREARLPYSRYKEMVKKVIEEQKSSSEKSLKELQEKLTPAEQRAQRLQDLEQAAEADPEGFLRLMARYNPGYTKFLQQQAAEKPKETVPEHDAEPEPDLPDGFSREGLKKWQQWSVRQAKREAVAEAKAQMEELYGPMAHDYQARKAYEQRQPVIAARRARLEQTYGDLLKTHEVELVAALKADTEAARREKRPATPAEMIVAEVLMPKIAADRNKMREELLKEEKQAAAAKAAASTRTAAQTGGESGAAASSTEDIIRRESQKLGSIT